MPENQGEDAGRTYYKIATFLVRLLNESHLRSKAGASNQVEHRQSRVSDLRNRLFVLLLSNDQMISPRKHAFQPRLHQAPDVRNRFQDEIAIASVNSLELNVRIEYSH